MERVAFTRTSLLVAALIAGLSGCGHHSDVTTQSSGAANPAGGTAIVPAGTVFYGKLDPSLGTKISKDGTAFTLTQTDTLLHKNPALHGAVIEGHVQNVASAGPMHKPAMTLVFDDIRMSDGMKAPVDVKLASMHAFEPKSHHLRTLGMMIGGAVVGHETAKHAGKHHGGLLGAAGGYVLSQTLKTDIAVPSGTVIELKFVSAATTGSN